MVKLFKHRPTVSAAALEPRRQSGRTSGHLRHAQGPDVLRAAQTRERQPDRSFLEHQPSNSRPVGTPPTIHTPPTASCFK